MERVKLNVGGKQFETTKETLLKSDYFKSLLEGNWKENQSNEELFIDRDPDLFQNILNILRGYDVPRTYLLVQEALFYGVEFNNYIGDGVGGKRQIHLYDLYYDESTENVKNFENNTLLEIEESGLIQLVAACNLEARINNKNNLNWNKLLLPNKYSYCSSVFAGSKINNDNIIDFEIVENCDLFYKLYLSFTEIQNLEENDDIFDLIEYLEFYIAGTQIHHITGKMLKAYLLLYHSKEYHVLKYNSKKTILVPFFNKNSPLPLIQNRRHLRCHLCVKLTRNDIKISLIARGIFLDHNERHFLINNTVTFPYQSYCYMEKDIENYETEIKVNGRVFKQFILIIEDENNQNTRSLISWKFTLNSHELFKTGPLYAEFLDKIDSNISIPENFPIYTYTFDHNISTRQIATSEMDIKTSINRGKIKILGVCTHLFSLEPNNILVVK